MTPPDITYAPVCTGGGWREPTAADLAAIEVEWPVLAAELAVVDAECRAAAWPGPVTRRALRRALRHLTAAYTLHAASCTRAGVAGA